jgi:diguanylate cyclase (GGDEF)-like protein/PAS domain S-box-containing protein
VRTRPAVDDHVVAGAQRRKPAGIAPPVTPPVPEPLDPAPSRSGPPPSETLSHPALDAFAAKWAKAVQKAGFVPMSGGDLRALLRGLAARFIDALHAEPFECAPGEEIGAALADAGCTEPEMLRASLTVLRDPPRAGAVPRPRRSERLARLHARVSSGYAGALRNRTLVEQERLARAIVAAHGDVERALSDSESRFRALFEGAALGIGMADIDGRIIQANAALGALLGYTPDELCRLNVGDLVHADSSPIDWGSPANADRPRDHVRLERAYYRKDGTVVWTDVTVSLLRDQAGEPRYTVAMVEDITDRHELEERLRYQALHDPLTGLPNRTFFAERLAEAFAGADPDALVGLCYLDLDGFKRIHDSLGHDVGDRLLIAVAKRLQRTDAARGHLVARMGGDEFVILSEKADHDELTTLADQVLYSLDLPVRSGPHGMRVSASIGIVAQPIGASGPAEILKLIQNVIEKQEERTRTRKLRTR